MPIIDHDKRCEAGETANTPQALPCGCLGRAINAKLANAGSGVELCASVSPSNRGCMKPVGHPGKHYAKFPRGREEW